MVLPIWTRDAFGGHPPDPDTWRCTRCPHQPEWPCPFARDHFCEHAATAPYTGLLILRWCYTQARPVFGDDRTGIVRARMLGWYEATLRRVDALATNQGHWPRRSVTR